MFFLIERSHVGHLRKQSGIIEGGKRFAWINEEKGEVINNNILRNNVL